MLYPSQSVVPGIERPGRSEADICFNSLPIYHCEPSGQSRTIIFESQTMNYRDLPWAKFPTHGLSPPGLLVGDVPNAPLIP
jgi:hypothetical protein